MKYNEEEINELVSKVDLLEYASRNFDFIKKSGNYYCSCPNHIDATPSLSINPEKNLFYCFSCGIGGSIIQWMIKFEGLTFGEAVNKLTEMTGTELKNLKQCDALAFYKTIKKSLSERKQSPIENVRRILPLTEIEKYKKEIPQEWVDEGILPQEMTRYNVRIDEYNNRIVYPVWDSNGKLISIKGRTRYKNYNLMKLPKYQYYYKIGTLDFFVGMKENLQSIVKQNEVIIFEGIKSGLKHNSFGFLNNWLSSETSWLSDEQVVLLIKMGVKNVIIAYDNDVSIEKIKEVTCKLRRFVNVFAVYDRKRLLGKIEEKKSPVDLGAEVWETLYRERIRI